MPLTMKLARPVGTALLALSIAGQAVAQEKPEVRDRAMPGIVLGLAALAVIGLALDERDDEEEDDVERLPVGCLADWPTRRGDVRLYDPGCLEERFGAAARLPLDCAVTVRSRGRFVSGFSPECLREEGWQTEN